MAGLSLVYLWLIHESICLSYAGRPDESTMERLNLYAGFRVPESAAVRYEIELKINL